MKIIGFMVVGPGEGDRVLDRALTKLDELCDLTVIWGDAPDEKTEEVIRKHKTEYHRYRSMWTEKQPEIKYTLLTKHVLPHNPDWIVAQDADEILDKRLTRERLEGLAGRGEIAFTFYCVHHYDTEDKMRVDDFWGGFRNVRFWRPIEGFPMNWMRSRFHCGIAPKYAYEWAADSEYIFQHFGYFTKEQREKKRQRYGEHDPDGAYISKGYYESILGEPRIKEFNYDEFVSGLRYEQRKPNLEKLKTRYMVRGSKETLYFKNSYGKIFSTSNEIVIEQWRNNPKMEEIKAIRGVSRESALDEQEINPLACVLCGHIAKDKDSLTEHASSHRKD